MKKELNKLKDKLFSKVHSNNLIYNTCWEDPYIDRKLLGLNSESNVVMITSAGCNALDYLLDSPAQINCIDLNFRQNALLELKIGLFKHGDYDLLFDMFGNGYHRWAKEDYHNLIRPILPKYAREFWDEKIKYFHKKDKKDTFYFHGTSGSFAWLYKQYLDRKDKARVLLNQILEAKSIEEQREIYKELEPKLLPKMINWLMNRHLTMTLLGVPRSQRQLILDKYPKGGVAEFIKESLYHIFVDLPFKTNYFWHLYIKGYYTKECCPEYLKEENFGVLNEEVNKLNIKTSSISNFLKENPGQYTHYILLDHQDWLSCYKPDLLIEEWEQILSNSVSGTKILMRSASPDITYLPAFVTEKIDFTNRVKEHYFDRVGTYGCTYLGIVK